MKNNEKKYSLKEQYEFVTMRTHKIFSSYNQQDFEKALKIVVKFSNMDRQRSNKPYYEYFIYQDYKDNKKGLEKLFDLCMLYDLNFLAFIDAQLFIDNLEIKVIIKAFKESDEFFEGLENQTSQEFQENLRNVIKDNINNFFSNPDWAVEEFKNHPKFNQNILKNTFREAIKELKENGFKPHINMPYDFDLDIDAIKQHENILMGKFTNKKTLAKMNTSYLSKIALDDFGVSEDFNTIYFKNLKDGIVQGYSERAFLIGIDKNKTLKDLQNRLKQLKDYDIKEAQTLINYTSNLIELVKQKRHKDKIPFKVIGKKLGMTTSEAKNYCKQLFNVNEKSFENFYKE